MGLTLPTYIPFAEAVARYQVPAETLTRAVESGMIRAVQINGEVAVADEDIEKFTTRENLWAQVKHLDGVPISMSDACTAYPDINFASLARWVEQGYIRVIAASQSRGKGHKRLLNQADVAYVALILELRGSKKPGKRLFTSDVIPPHLIQPAYQ